MTADLIVFDELNERESERMRQIIFRYQAKIERRKRLLQKDDVELENEIVCEQQILPNGFRGTHRKISFFERFICLLGECLP